MQTIAVIGAGVQGRAFAFAAARAGYRVVLEDVLPSKLRIAEQEFSPERGVLRFASTVEDAVREADFAIDFVPDELESKLEMVCMIDRMAPPRTVLLIHTVSLDPDDLASCTYRADRCMRVWFVDGMLQTAAGTQTSSETTRQVEVLVSGLTAGQFSGRKL